MKIYYHSNSKLDRCIAHNIKCCYFDEEPELTCIWKTTVNDKYNDGKTPHYYGSKITRRNLLNSSVKNQNI